MAVLQWETSEMHLVSFLIFSQCDNGGVCVCCVCTRMCVFLSPCILPSHSSLVPRALATKKKKPRQTSKLHAFSHFAHYGQFILYFLLSPSHVNSLIIKRASELIKRMVEKQRIQRAWRAEMTSVHLTGVFDCI